MPALEWVLTKFGQEPPNKAAWDFMSQDWIDKMHDAVEPLTLNATNITVKAMSSSFVENRRRRLLQDNEFSTFNVFGKMNYFKPESGGYVEVIIAPESLKFLLDIFAGSDEWTSEDDFAKKRQEVNIINVTRQFRFYNLKAENLDVNGNCVVQGTLDTVGQTNNYGSVDFYPGDMFGGMFSFGKGLKGSLGPAKPHRIGIHGGELEMDGQMCGCSSR